MIYFKKILCPIDYSDCSMNALGYAVKMAIKDSARLYLMYVEDDECVFDYGGLSFGYESTLDPDTVVEMKKKLMDSVSEDVREYISVETLITIGIPVDEIIKVAKRKRIDIIVMGTHGRTGISHMVIGSVAEKVIRRSPCPVLCIKDN
ncbi:MAG: universal stress protein [Candidatus Jettenia sp. CY-1]|nr:universal stress protein [Candidatus Jettenia sp.]WKZ17738.1 MAG: universal stress protein [Candidatus Jettenia sp. CY-1]